MSGNPKDDDYKISNVNEPTRASSSLSISDIPVEINAKTYSKNPRSIEYYDFAVYIIILLLFLVGALVGSYSVYSQKDDSRSSRGQQIISNGELSIIDEKVNSNETTDSIDREILDVAAIFDMAQVSHGEYHDCGIYTNSKVYCWGNGPYGQLGTGPKILSSEAPVAVDDTGALSGLTIKKISSGDYHTCVIASNNQAYCWGVGAYGQIGNGFNTSDNYTPQAVYMSGVLKNKTLIDIESSKNYTCVTTLDDQMYCWGLGIFGEDEHQNLKSNNVPVLVR